MNNKLTRFYMLALCFILLNASCKVQKNQHFKTDSDLIKIIDQNLNDAAQQYHTLMQQLPAGRFPRSFDPKNGELKTSGSEWWCSGFYPGTLLYLNENAQDTILNNEALRILKLLEKEQYNKSTHDLGFMMFCSFGNANRIALKPEYKDILINSAKSLCSRFDPKVGCIKSWDSKKSDFLVIIDNMMNLELLFWATKTTGDSSYYKIAVRHANTTMKNHFRPDYSSYHVINYNTETGDVQQKKTAQGAADESAWARGQAWGLYGYTLMYRATNDKKYLEQANHIANFILTNPNLPVNKVPYWDFNAAGIPDALRDASAASIMASALLELSGYADKKSGNTYFNAASTMLKSLASTPYKSAKGANGGFILNHSVGHLPQKSEVDVSLTYADYYFVEAMMRYKALATK